MTNTHRIPTRHELIAQAYVLLGDMLAHGIPSKSHGRVVAFLEGVEALMLDEALEARAEPAPAPAPAPSDNLLRILGVED